VLNLTLIDIVSHLLASQTRLSDVQLKVVPETLVLNPLDLVNAEGRHGVPEQLLHLLVLAGGRLQHHPLQEMEERRLDFHTFNFKLWFVLTLLIIMIFIIGVNAGSIHNMLFYIFISIIIIPPDFLACIFSQFSM